MPDEQASAASRLAADADFRAAVSQIHPDLEAIRQTVIQAYEAATGTRDPDPRTVSTWFAEVCNAYDSRVRGGISVERPILRRVMSSNITRKVEHVMLRQCRLCDMYSQVDYIAFFLRVPPSSHQASDTAIRRAFKRAITADLERKNFDFSEFAQQRLCVAVTFVVANGRRRADVDNLAKNLLDALQSFAYDNDRQIDHLDLVRLRSRSTEEFMTVRMACTDIDGVRDVISPTFPVEWVTSASMTDVSAYLGETGGTVDEPPGQA